MSFITSPGDGRLAILKILNIITDKNYSLSDVVFSNPVRNTDATKNRNTKVTVTFKSEYGNYGVKEIFYNRIHIGDLPVLTVVRGSATTYHELIPVLNSTYNLNLTTADLDNGALPSLTTNVTITLPVADNSYLYYDSAAISTAGFTPSYDIFKPSHTLLSYLCDGFTRYGQYSDNAGGIYNKLLQTNSPDCGFEDGLPRIELTNPGTMSVLEEANSGVFTLELINPVGPVTVTLTAPGLTFSTNNIVLDTVTPTATFTVSSNNPGIYEIVVTNNAAISNPIDRFFTIIDKYNTTYSISVLPELESFVTQNSGLFTIQGLNIDPDEPVTVTINAADELTSSVPSVILTSAQPTATFTVSSNVSGVFFISFTNNRGLQNPQQIAYLVRPTVSLTLTPPSGNIVDEQQSGLFTVTMINGFEDVTITPIAPGSALIFPSSFILTPQEPTGSFRLTYSNVGSFDVDITNNGGISNPATYEVNVLPAPYITVTPPGSNIYTGQTSGNFTVELFNALEPVTVTLLSNTDSISTTSIVLNPQTPLATFTVTEAQEGNYLVSFTNNRGYSITTDLNIVVLRTLIPQILFENPTSLNLEVGDESGNFTVTLIDHPGPVTVTINTTAGITSSKSSVILDSTNNSDTFTVTAQSSGSKTISITNSAGIPNPGNSIFTVRLPDFVQLTTVPAVIRANTLSDNFLVTLLNPVVPVTVTPTTENGVFTPSSVILSVGQPSASFRGTFTQEGAATLTLGTSPTTPATAPANITVLEQILPEITLTGPSGTVYPGDQSGNFTLTLINGQSSVVVTIVSETDSTSVFSVTLTPAQPSATFTVADNQAGVYNVGVTNNGGLSNPAPIPITISADTGSLQFTGPALLESEAGDVSGNFTVTGVNLVRSVLIAPDTSGNKTFTPSSFTLTPGQPSATFTLNSTDIGIKAVSITNNRGYSNPAAINYEFKTPTFPYLSLTGPTPNTVFVNEESGDFTITLNNPENSVTVNVQVFKNQVDVTAQVIQTNGFLLTTAQPTATFKLLPQIDGLLEVFITNAASIQVPSSAVTITSSLNTVISLNFLGSDTAATCFEDTVYVLNINRNHSSGSTQVNLPAIPGVNFQYSQITIFNGENTYPVNVTFNNVDLYEIYATYGSGVSTNVIEVQTTLKPSYSITPADPLSIQEDLAPVEFTVTGANLIGPLTISIASWAGSGLSTNTIIVTPADPVETFTIAPTIPGSYNLVFTNNASLPNNPNISVTVLQKPTLTLVRTGTGDLTREQDVTFTVTLQNGTSPVEITPVTDAEVVVDGYTPPLVLTPAQPSATFTVNSDIPGTYNIGVSNNASLTNPNTVPITVINGNLNITVVNTSLEVGVESDEITVELENYDLPTIVTINLTNFIDGTLTIDPSDQYSPNQLLLNSSNRIGLFTITKLSTGTVNLSLTNNKSLINPTAVDLGFFDEPMYTVLSPLIETDLLNQTIGPYTVSGQTLNVPINDKLHWDPHKANVVLYLDFSDPIGNVITDKSPFANAVSVFGNAQIDSFSPIYGDRGYLSPTATGDYLSVNNVGNLFNFPGDFTFEIDLVRAAVGEEILIERYHPSNTNSFIFGFDNGNKIYWNNSGNVLTCNTAVTSANGTCKIAVSRIGSSLRIFLNGVLDGEYTNSTDYTSDPLLVPVLGLLGRVNSRYSLQDFSGRVGKIKITNGVGRFSGNYIPESINPNKNITVYPYYDRLGTDTYKNNTVLYLDFTDPVGNVFTDYSVLKNKVTSVGNVAISTVDPIYGDTVGLFDGGSDYLTINQNVTNFHFPGDFTIEIDFKNAVSPNNSKSLLDLYKPNIQGYYHLWINQNGKLEWIGYDSGIIRRESNTLVNTLQVAKIAISRAAGIFRMYINGFLEIETPDNINYSPSIVDVPQLGIGAQVSQRNSTYDFYGRIGRVKITKGVGRYTGSSYVVEPVSKITYTPNKIQLTEALPNQTFNINSSAVGTFVTSFYNYDNLPNPANKSTTFQKLPTISLISGSLNLIVGQPTNDLTLSLVDATVPVEITFILPAGLQFANPPVGLNNNKIILSSANQTVLFTLVSTVSGTHAFSITNNKSLTNPGVLNYTSVYLTTIEKTEPVVKTVFVKDRIVGYDLHISNINENTTVHTYVDNLLDDPHANNVSLLLDFNGEVNDTTVVDYSPRKKTLFYGQDFKLDNLNESLKEIALVAPATNNCYLSVRQTDNVTNYNDLIFGTENFTIEIELLLTTSNVDFYLLESRTNSANGFYLYINPTGFVQWFSLGVAIATSTIPVNDGIKHHIALSRVGTQLYLLIDGTVNVTVTDATNYNSSSAHFAIGKQLNFASAAQGLKGKLASIKVTKGVGRYNSNITNYGIKKLKTTPYRRTFTANGQNQLFDFDAAVPGDYPLKAYSEKAFVLPTVTNLSFKKNSTFNLVIPSSKISNVNEASNTYRINLIDPSIPVKIYLNPQSGLAFNTGPTNLTNTNEITLDSTNSFSVFTLISSVPGSYTLSFTNNSGLVNLEPNVHSFVDEGAEPLFINENDLHLNLNKPEDIEYSLNIFQSII